MVIFDGSPADVTKIRVCAKPISELCRCRQRRFEVEQSLAGYGPTRVLEGISFSVPAGARLAVLGRNGMGKRRCSLRSPVRRAVTADASVSARADVTTLPSASRALKGPRLRAAGALRLPVPDG